MNKTKKESIAKAILTKYAKIPFYMYNFNQTSDVDENYKERKNFVSAYQYDSIILMGYYKNITN